MGKLYDQQHIDASNYTLYLEIGNIEKFNSLNSIDARDQTRGQLLKKAIYDQIQIHGLNIVRIDLVYDRYDMINLIEQRGLAIKLQNYEKILKIEHKIEQLKESEYEANIIGAYITYENISDVKHASVLFM